ncbi:MAG: cytochrome c oxidase assembly protein [Chloroflexota bacterium]
MLAAGCILGARPLAAHAHDGAPPAPHDIWHAWSREPATLLGLALATWVYARGVRALWRRAGQGQGIHSWQAFAFAGGEAALFLALISPLDALGEALFSAHMVQHLLLMVVAAPLLVLGRPLVPLLWTLPARWRRAVGRWWHGAVGVRAAWRAASHPLLVWGLHVGAVWVWHTPGLYQAALRSEVVHIAEHACFLATAVLFWWVLVHARARGRLGYGAGVLYVFAMAVQSGVLGALITFAPTAWYPIHQPSVAAWGLTPLEDQQLAGLAMWVPAGLAYTAAALSLFVAWLGEAERAARRIDARHLQCGRPVDAAHAGS